MKIFTQIKTLALVAGMVLTSNAVMAGDGTKANPYTVAELNAQKDALATSGDTVWVKADLKGLGADGTQTENAGTTQCAGLFGDASASFVAYSYQILGELAMTDLTNTEELLIALTYGTTGHPYGNTSNPQFASNYEPTDAHFSLVEVHNALTLTINGLRGYHVPSCYVVPKNVIAVKVNAGYSMSKGAYVTCTNFVGSEATYVTPKNSALVLMTSGIESEYKFVLSSGLYDQTFSNGNTLNPGTQAGATTATKANRARFLFVSDASKSGFENNGDNIATVVLNSKDEIFLEVSSQETNFYGKWTWETAEKNWITWGGGKYADYKDIFDFRNNNLELPVGTSADLHAGDLDGVEKTMGDVTISFTAGNNPGSRYFYNSSKENHFNPSKNSTFTLKAAEGKAIKNVSIYFQSGKENMTVDNGTYADGIWRGNAEAVTFTAPLARYIWNIDVVTAAADEETVTEVKEVMAEGAEKKAPAAKGIYDLYGNRVNLMQKGNVYIIDGKKYFK